MSLPAVPFARKISGGDVLEELEQLPPLGCG
jgi:hypothetical protein